jgi:maltose O-acetyltransferase
MKDFVFLSLISGLMHKYRLMKLRSKGAVIGQGTYISPKAYIDTHGGSRVVIGINCYVTRQVIILNHSDVLLGGPQRKWQAFGAYRISKDVVIGDNVFIGVNSTIMPGIKIGDNVIVGANTLVNKDIPSGLIVGGCPFKIIGKTADMLESRISNFDVDKWHAEFSGQ